VKKCIGVDRIIFVAHPIGYAFVGVSISRKIYGRKVFELIMQGD